MYASRPGLLIAFHGCDIKLRDQVLNGKAELQPSNNEYDWLGNGIYFWENNLQRAFQFAEELKTNPRPGKPRINTPAVLGAVINLGLCLDLLDNEYLDLLKESYKTLELSYQTLGMTLPSNTKGKGSDELLLRHLDCLVIEHLHKSTSVNFDSVKGVFVEGNSLYQNSGFNEKNHIQICIRNPNCIKGYFLPRELNKQYKRV